MKIQNLRINYMYKLNQYQPKVPSFASCGGVIDDGDYVKIPKKKYKREQVLEYILCGILGAELIYKIIELWGKGGKPPFP